MKKIILSLCVLSVNAFADPPEARTVDFSGSYAPSLECYQATLKNYQWSLRNGSATVNGAGQTPFMTWATNANASAVVTSACTWVTQTTGVFNARLDPAMLNTNGSYIYEVGLLSNSIPSVARQGVFTIRRSPFAVGNGAAMTLTTNLNASLYNWIGSFNNLWWIPTNAPTPGYGLYTDGFSSYYGVVSGAGDLKADGTVKMTAAFNNGGQRSTNAAIGTASNDLAILSQVQGVTNSMTSIVYSNPSVFATPLNVIAATNEMTSIVYSNASMFATSSQVFWLDGRYAGNRSVWGSGLNITNIDVTADGASQHGQNSGTMLIKPYAYGASQYGENQGIMIIGDSAQGSSQRGVAGASAGVMIIADNAIGSSQYGWNYRGIVTNDGAHGVLQLFYLTTGQTSLVTSAGSGSIILGAGIASNKNSITAGDGQISHGDGSVSASGGFFDNGSRACTNNGTYTFSGSIDRATTVTGGQSNTISTALQPGNTNNWEIGAHGTFVTVGTTNIFVTGTDTNGWVISSHGTFVTTGTTNIFVTALDTNGWNLVVPATTNTFLAAGATNLMFKKDGSIVATGNFNHGGYSSTNLSSILFPSSLSAFFLGNNAMEYGIQIGNEGTMIISHTNNVTLQGGNTVVEITSASVDFNWGGSAINLTNGTLRGLADRATTVTGGQSNTLSTAYSWVNGNSNGVASLFSRSNTWDSTASTVSSMPTNDWNTAYGWVNGNSNGVASLFSRSNAWDSAASTVQSTLDAVYTNNSTFSLAASQVTTNFALTGLTWNTPEIIRGRLYISATNVIPFSQTATLTFREREARTAGAAIWQANMGLSAVWLASNVVVGATNVWVADSTDFAANNLVYLTGTTNEFVRVLSISGNNLILKYATTASHVDANTDIAARVREFGGFGLYDSSGSKTIWGSVDLTTATNATIKMDIEYTK